MSRQPPSNWSSKNPRELANALPVFARRAPPSRARRRRTAHLARAARVTALGAAAEALPDAVELVGDAAQAPVLLLGPLAAGIASRAASSPIRPSMRANSVISSSGPSFGVPGSSQ